MKIVRGILAVIVGIIAGSVVNIGIIFLCGLIFGFPKGMNMWDADSVRAYASQLTTANYVGVLVAHQLGTLVGAFVAAKIATGGKMIFALVIGVWFLLGGVYAASLIPAPMWFVIVDLACYLPVAFIGGKLGGGNKAATEESPVNKAASDAAE
jgi:hypothetical protein